MFSKVKKLFTVLAIVMMVSSSLPLNVLADESTSTKTENVTTTGGSEQTQTTSSTEGTKASKSDTTSTSEETTKPSNEGTSESQPNAPNSSNTGVEDKDAKGDEIPSEIKPEEKPTVTEDDLAKLQEELGKLGLQYRDGELANKDNTSSIKEPEVIQRALALLREYQAKVQGKANRLVKVGFSANATTVYVDRNTGYNNVHFTRKGETEWGWYMKRDSEGDPLWCIQPTVPLNWGANGGFSRNSETSALYQKASLIAWFGYFKQPSVMNAFYTEMLIGETVEGSGPTAIWGGGYSLEGYSAFRNAVLANVDTFFRQPSFASQTHTLKVGESITLTDTTGSLRNYVLKSSGGADVTRNGNSITITPNINTPDTTRLLFKFDIPASYEGATLVYRQSGLQNVISAHVADPTNFVVTINTLKNGEGKLGKVDENGKPVPNAEFEVKNTATGETRTLTTNEHGEFNVTYPHGTVLEIHETKAPYGFYRDQETKTVTIQANQTVNVSFTNIHQKGKLTLTKEDAETRGTPQGDASLDNSVYALYKADGTFVQNIEFNGREGVADNLDLGDYYVQEVTAPKGYVLDTQKHNITIAYAGQDVKVSLTNSVVTDRVIKGSIKGWKFGNKSLIDKNVDLFNGNGNIKNPLEGVEITARSYTTGKEYKTVTDKNGYFEINNLPYDKYQLVESKGKEGYRLIMPFDFEIRTDGVVHQYLLEDKVIENKVKVVKQDAVTGKTIPIAHVQFKIFDTVKGAYISMLKPNSDESSEIFETNAEGYLVTSDTLLYGKDRYRLEEVQAPYRYTKGNPIFFSVDSKGNAETVVVNYKNVEQTSRVVLTKTVEKPVSLENKSSSLGAYKEFKFAQQGGQGFEFKIRAAEDIVKPEGTLVYHKGDFVKVTTEASGYIPNGAEEDEVITTDVNGRAISYPKVHKTK